MGKILSQIRKIRNRYEYYMTIDENSLMFRIFKKNNIGNDFNLTFNQSKFLLSELQNAYCETFPNHQQIIPNLN